MRDRAGEESGVVLVIVAICLVAFLGMAALAIDVGSFYQAQTKAQAAADAGALAAADTLGERNPPWASVGTSYATTNYPGSTVQVSQPTPTTVKVTVSASTPEFFGRIWGKASTNVGASAVATEKSAWTPCTAPGNNCYAVFAMDSSCTNNGFTGGGGIHITGGVHSNGSMTVGGGGSSFGPTTYGDTSGCTVGPSGYGQQNNTFNSSPPTPQAEDPILAWPIDYSTDFPACSGSSCTGPCATGAGSCASTLKTPSFCTQASTTTPWSLVSYYPYTLTSDNIYCGVGTGNANDPSTWNGEIDPAQTGSGTIESSYVGGSLKIGGGSNLEACGYAQAGYTASGCTASTPTPKTANYPLFYATQPDPPIYNKKGQQTGTGYAVDETSGGGTLTGDVFAPKGTIAVGGGSSTAFLEGQDVNWSGGGIYGDGPDDTSGGGSGSGSASLLQ